VPPTEAGEVVQTEKVSGCLVHGVDVERFGEVPDQVTLQGICERLIQDEIAVATTLGAEPGVEIRSDDCRRSHDDLWTAHSVQRARQAVGVDRRVGLEGDDLASCVDACVGATSAGERNRMREDLGEGVGQAPLDGVDPLIYRKAAESRAVIGEVQPELQIQTSSRRAMGALSPGRGPSLRIRV
jgi:hypothetical protein